MHLTIVPSQVESDSEGGLILASLVLSMFSIISPGPLTGVLLIDIGASFGSSVGVVGQIRTVASVVTVISALVMGVLSVRFRHKSLLLAGLSFIIVSALGCGFAPSFNMMLLSFSLSGLGLAMVMPMAYTITADHFPLEKRARAVGWIVAGMSLSAVIGAPVSSFIAGFGGWRMAFLGFVFPISSLSLLLAARVLPSTSSSLQSTINPGSYLEGFKVIISNGSATACLIGLVLSMASFQVIMIYDASFFRQRFLLPTGYASIYVMVSATCYTLGSLFGGRLVDRFGRKQLTILGNFFMGILIISFINLPNIWGSLILACLGGLSAGVRYSALSSLTMEQVPEFRGTMMSAFSAARSMGIALGAGVGGLVLLLYDYEFLGISLGIIGIISAMTYWFFTIDPTKTES